MSYKIFIADNKQIKDLLILKVEKYLLEDIGSKFKNLFSFSYYL